MPPCLSKFQRLEAFSAIDIYPVTCQELSNNRSDFEVLKEIIKGGAKIVQLRDKSCSKKEVYEKAVKFREITRSEKLLLIINDYLDIAVATDADGVHLGQNDFPINEAKRLFPDLIIGGSTHSLEQALKAEKEGADYVNIGPIYSTNTKKGAAPSLGPKAIREISAKITIPFTVMGGINGDNLDEVLGFGAQKIAMVSAITKARDIAETIRNFRDRIVSIQ